MERDHIESDPLKFASLMAHQLQSPLAAAVSLVDAVLTEHAGPLSAAQRETLEKAGARCGQAITAVRRMLAIFQAQTGGAGAPARCSLAAAVRQAEAQYAPEAGRRGIVLRVDVGADPAPVVVSDAAAGEILAVLLGNALKYTPDRGRVAVTLRDADAPGRVLLTVEDSGIGVPEEYRERIFEPFFRSPSARQSARPGVGLGLAFVRSLLSAAGGEVSVRRSPLGGAAFTLEFPCPSAEEGAPAGGHEAPAFRVVIVGGVAAGPKAAAKIIRLRPDADVTIVEKGNVMSYAGCGLPYYVSGVVRDQKQLISSPAGVARDPVFFLHVKNVHVLNHTEAAEIDRAGRRVRVVDLASGRSSWLPYDELLLATGASAVVPPELKTELRNVFTLHGVRDAEGIRSALADGRARDVVIVGGGLLGVEMTEALVSKGARVTIVERRPHILPMVDAEIAALVERHMEARGVRILTGARVTAARGEGAVTAVATDRGDLPADMVILAAGVRPNVELAAQSGLAIGVTGAILTDRSMRTSDPHIFAAGDCVESAHLVTGAPCYIPLGSTANKQGRTAAVNICGGSDEFPGVFGSSVLRVFDYSVARTGLGEAEARAAGHRPVSVLVPGPDRAHYMPNANLLLLKLIVDADTRRLLGAQATGRGVADKRIDVATMAIAAGMTVDAIAQLDLCYAPPYAEAMDNIITAANVARNKLDGHMAGIGPAEVREKMRRPDDFVLLDVRTPEEHERGRLPRSVSIPLGSLRGRIGELPRDREIVCFCDISLRGYEAALILRAAGFERVAVMEGGLAMWPYETVS